MDAYRVFYGKVATIGHYNLVSIPHFCRNSLFWEILVNICSLRCTANCSVLYGELPKITFVLYGSLLGRLEYKVQKKHETEQIQDRHLSNTFSSKIPIIELFELALNMLIWHLFFCFFRNHIFDLKARSKKHIAKWPRFQILTMLRQEVWHP